jgi:hypothetical protein
MLAGLLVAVTGCGATASISAARDSSEQRAFRRVYVAVDQGNVDPEFAETLHDALARELGSRGVLVQARVLTGLELDERTVDADVKAWHPDGVLLAAFAGGSGAYGDIDQATYDVSLIDAASGRRIWRARVSSRKVFGSRAGMMEETASRIGERLEQDHLIGSR